MRRKHDRWWMLVVPVGLAAALAGGSPAPEAGSRPSGPVETAAAPDGDGAVSPEDDRREPRRRPGAGGLRVELDPATGRLVQRTGEPGERGAVRHPGDRFSTYGGDLLQEPLPGGGFKVDLRGRFQSAVVATIDPETGETEIDCVRTPAPAGGEAGDGG